MDNYIQIGKDRIPISCETAENFREQFGKPLIRHGDYGICLKHGERCGFVYDGSSSQFFVVSPTAQGYEGLYRDVDKIIRIIGNFDDIKAKESEGEDLRDWESSAGQTGESIIMRVSENKIWLGTCGCSDYYTLDQAKEIHQKLGQIIATAKRKDC